METDVRLGDGRTLHVYDTGAGDLPVVWHHGTPNVGAPPRPLSAAAARLGVRFVSYDRPGYGGSTPRPERDVASAAEDVAYTSPWGFDPGEVTVPVLLVHGRDDAMVPVTHARWLAQRLPAAELWERPGEGHVSILRHADKALEWLAGRMRD